MKLPLELPDTDWRPVVEAWAVSPVGQKLEAFLEERAAAGATIYPPEPLRALTLTPLSATRVVILGQDPYHGPGQAEGLSFSVPPGVPLPPSLRNIFKEIQRDLGKPFPPNGSLVRWAEGGTLLLNAVLTVEDGQPASHANRGWEVLTDALIKAAAEDAAPKVFMLWGSYAQAKAPLIEAAHQGHLVLKANHPSPLSALKPPRPFIGCGHFSTAKAWLEERGRGVPRKG
ncbi:uracil-DNA glycosylase [Pelomonas saccharophila]|uniref:Uracil-DNA glycosylase n=1 Tax=Roseateles saccharophilus TaxID=304 RepID=A0ABU1YNK3_ROSSA|nr:uracil-DNA glycosylase [Roseateles saccharophilus]MDR7270419.1 uracil-DNA glycosylase [Roseateles saccharophilus]